MSNADRLCDLHGPSKDTPDEARAEPERKPRRKRKSSGVQVGVSAAQLGPEAARYRKAGQNDEDCWRFFEKGEEPRRLYEDDGVAALRDVLDREDVRRVDVDVRVVRQ